METKTKRFACDTVCGFSVQGFDEKEIQDIAIAHVKKGHPSVEITEERVKGLIETVEQK